MGKPRPFGDSMPNLKTKRISDGVYEFVYGDTTLLASRLPDLYFEIELSGEKHKGYLKDLKAKFVAHLTGEPVKTSVKSKPSDDVDEDIDIVIQRHIDQADDRLSQILKWVAAYNCETVAVKCGKSPRYVFVLPPGPEPVPPLAECYHKTRDQYIWPRKIPVDLQK